MPIKFKRFFGRLIPHKYQWWGKQITLLEGSLYYKPEKQKNVKFTFSFYKKIGQLEEVYFKELAIEKLKNDEIRYYITEEPGDAA